MLRPSDILRCVGFLIALVSTAVCQTTNGTILGIVTDPSGAAVSGAIVQVVNESTGARRELITNSEGLYQALALSAGAYSIAVIVPGFQSTTYRGVELQVQQTARFNISLELQRQAEAVSVSARAPLLDSDSAAVGAVIDSARLIEMPLNGRDFNQLSLLSAGVVQFGSGGTAIGFAGQLGIGVSTNGTRFAQQNYQIDGMANYNERIYSTSINPSVDMIQEFKIQTSTYSAEYGLGGSSVSVAFKSGTNVIHGSLFDYFRNTVLNARGFFAPSRQDLKRNQFGGTVGGPIRRNRTFFFGGYEGVRQRTASLLSGPVLTLAERSGVFSQAIRDPLTNQPFAAQTIPSSRIDPIAKLAMDKFLPLPNFGDNFARFLSPVPELRNQIGMRFDQIFSTRDTVFARFMRQYQSNQPTQGLTKMAYAITYFSTHTATGWTHTFTPAIINEARASYRREVHESQNVLLGSGERFNFNKFAGILGLDTESSGAPYFNVAGLGALGSFFAPSTGHTDVYEVSDSVSWIRGAHTLKFGGGYRDTWYRTADSANKRGNYVYSGGYTGLPTADFLLGTPARVLGDQPAPAGYLRWAYADMFVQDDWKVTSRLTLNLGLRYGIDVPAHDKYDTFATYDFTRQQVVVAGQDGKFPAAVDPATIRNSPGQFITAKDAGYPLRTLRDMNWRDLDPRFGFAWRPFSSLVFRGGYGISYTPRDAYTYIINRRQPFTPGRTIENTNPPTLDTKDPYRNFQLTGTALNATGTYRPRNSPDAYLQQYSFGVQKELSSSLKLDVSYVRTKGTHLLNQYTTLNRPAPGPGPIEPRRPIPGLGGFSTFENDGNLTYNSLQTTLTKRFSRGLTFTSAFTWGKALDTDSGSFYSGMPYDTDYNNRALSRGRTDMDVATRWVSNYIYELPFGLGRHFLDRRGILNGLVGGWQLSGIFVLQSGLPFSALVQGDPGNVGASWAKPNRLAPGNNIQPTLNRWFDPNAFEAPGDTQLPLNQRTDFRFGTSGRNILNQDGIINWDAGLYKSFRIRENHDVQARIEAFNSANHPNFDAPGNSIIPSKFLVRTTADLNPTFGKVTSASSPRLFQVALRYTF